MDVHFCTSPGSIAGLARAVPDRLGAGCGCAGHRGTGVPLGAAPPAGWSEWTDQLAIIREDNAFRYDKDVLPAAEGAALWAAFNVEMDRLYGVMNEGKEPDFGD